MPIRYQEETSTLIVDPDATSADGTSYSVRSAIMDLSPEQLRSADPNVPAELSSMLDLPADFSDSVRQTATDVVAGATTPYDQALALQDFFRSSGGFVYDLEIDSGHSDDAIESFLETRRGYCEQFAGTFAAMARAVGLPARVAVGFTWGDVDPDQPGVYQVRGRNAHAWPEVYLGAYGWVGFEPTPGRGSPSGESYTGESPSQESGPVGSDSSPSTTVDPSPSTTAPTDEEPPGDEQASDLLNSGPAGSQNPGGGTSWTRTTGSVLLIVLVAAVGYLLIGPGLHARRHRRRRRAAVGSPPAEVAVAWAETAEHLSLLDLAPNPDETHAELADRVGEVLPDQTAAVHQLAAAADAATYGPDVIVEETAEQARADADTVIASVMARVPWWRRGLVALDPRPSRPDASSMRHRVDRPHD